MMDFNSLMYGSGFGHMGFMSGFGFGSGFLLVVVWSLFWKGLALWHSARRNEPVWFVALLLINTLGILEIIYLFGFAKQRFDTLFSKHEPKHHE